MLLCGALATFVPWVAPKLPAIPKAAVGAPRTTTAMPAAQSSRMSRGRGVGPQVSVLAGGAARARTRACLLHGQGLAGTGERRLRQVVDVVHGLRHGGLGAGQAAHRTGELRGPECRGQVPESGP